ncbi:hypothetical protein MKW94_004242 [Papaver nudicaule]|uniref:SnoaL-like domain-containing protein n=1 Tax=Papaver nudicaule TaxID=74823 RepID=A0AA41RN33_PAPNU|nr:hypothetical protein [Papaver nudicaule]
MSWCWCRSVHIIAKEFAVAYCIDYGPASLLQPLIWVVQLWTIILAKGLHCSLVVEDFTAEQEGVIPVNGWKAYYAATRAIMNINAEFYNIIRDRSLPRMGGLWLNADYVKCVHASGELFSGYDAVMESWQLAFNWGQGVAYAVRDVKTRVFTDMAWVTMKAYLDDLETGPFNVSNVYEFHKGQWYLVHHHCSVILIDHENDQQNAFG